MWSYEDEVIVGLRRADEEVCPNCGTTHSYYSPCPVCEELAYEKWLFAQQVEGVSAMVECPQCGGEGFCVPGARVGHWEGLMPWSDFRPQCCPLCEGMGVVSSEAASRFIEAETDAE